MQTCGVSDDRFMFGAATECRLTLIADLMVLAVDPNHQRRGIGRKLVRWGLEQAAAEDQKVFLIATPEGKPLYESLGFRVLGDFDAAGLLHYSMLWKSDVTS
jgi:ribosomal protein S18 acetylase RimI-like enzyme